MHEYFAGFAREDYTLWDTRIGAAYPKDLLVVMSHIPNCILSLHTLGAWPLARFLKKLGSVVLTSFDHCALEERRRERTGWSEEAGIRGVGLRRTSSWALLSSEGRYTLPACLRVRGLKRRSLVVGYIGRKGIYGPTPLLHNSRKRACVSIRIATLPS